MNAETAIETLILPALQEVLVSSKRAGTAVGPDTNLLGRESVLDSLGLVTLIANVEAAVQEKLNRSLVLATEAALSRGRSPFRTVSTFGDYLQELLEAKEPGGNA